jgi:tetratricopeptide (TPR) repeat protein
MSVAPIEIFFSYAHEDEPLRDKLARQLKVFESHGVILGWHDRQITAGSEWAKQIDERLNTADLILLLISEDFLASDYCYKVEMPCALERRDKGEACVIPIILRPCPWEHAPFKKLNVLPTDARPAVEWLNLDRAFLNIVEGIEAAIAAIKAKRTSGRVIEPGASHLHKPSLPPIWNVPHHRNRNFTGREEELNALRDSLRAGETTALVQAQAIHGLGGVGKTQLATEYAYRNAADYDIVWWVRSEDPTTLASDYAALAVKLDLPEKDEPKQSVIVEAVKEWLRLHTGWLLIFDNVVDAASVRGYIPPGDAGHTIITSRSPSWRGVASPLSVYTLPMDEAVAFLLKRTGEQDQAAAKNLAEALGRLPLALEQASAYIEASGSSMARYLKLFTERQREMLQRGKPSTEYPDTIATTWSLSFQNVERDNPAAADLLRLCAFFAPDDIPLKILIDGIEEMPESLAVIVADELSFNDALAALRQYSLIEVKNEKITIHRLVQAVIRHALDDMAFKQWIGVAVQIVDTSFPTISNVRTWPICAPLLPHALSALTYVDAIQFSSDQTAGLFNSVGLYLRARAENTEAKRMYERALAINEAALGHNHTAVAVNLANLGEVLVEQGDPASAMAYLERALAIDEAAFGPNHPDVAIDLRNLAKAALGAGNINLSKALIERAITIDEDALGHNHPKVAIGLNNLGTLLMVQQDYDSAKIRLERALAINEAAPDPDYQEIAINLYNLGRVLQAKGNLDGAKPILERSLHIFRSFLGDEHPSSMLVEQQLRLVEEEMKEAKS